MKQIGRVVLDIPEVDKVSVVIIEACLAYEFRTNWRLVLKKATYKAVGQAKKRYLIMMKFSDKQMDLFIETFLENVGYK